MVCASPEATTPSRYCLNLLKNSSDRLSFSRRLLQLAPNTRGIPYLRLFDLEKPFHKLSGRSTRSQRSTHTFKIVAILLLVSRGSACRASQESSLRRIFSKYGFDLGDIVGELPHSLGQPAVFCYSSVVLVNVGEEEDVSGRTLAGRNPLRETRLNGRYCAARGNSASTRPAWRPWGHRGHHHRTG